MIEVRGLTKRFGPRLAVDALSFDVRPGRVTGFLGPNGSGKSTTMRLILGLDHPDAEHFVHTATADTVAGGQRGQVAARGPARVPGPGFEQRPGLTQRPAQVPVPAATDRGVPGVRVVQAQDQPHGSGLA